MSVAEQVRKEFQRLSPGEVVVTADLHPLSGDSSQVDKAVSRIYQDAGLRKLRNGMYYKPLKSKYLGQLPPKANTIIKSVRKQYKTAIVPSGPLAAYELGFTGERPPERIYDTDKRLAGIDLENDAIRFRQVVAKKLALGSVKLITLINGLEFFLAQRPNLNYSQEQLVKRRLSHYSHRQIVKVLSARPLWLRERIESLLKDAKEAVYITGVSALNVPFQGQVGDWHQMGMLVSNKFHLAGENYQGCPDLSPNELFDCSGFLNKHNIKLSTTQCAKPQRAIKDILYSNIVAKNRYPSFFMKEEYLLPLSDNELKSCVGEVASFANAQQSKLLDKWMKENGIH